MEAPALRIRQRAQSSGGGGTDPGEGPHRTARAQTNKTHTWRSAVAMPAEAAMLHSVSPRLTTTVAALRRQPRVRKRKSVARAEAVVSGKGGVKHWEGGVAPARGWRAGRICTSARRSIFAQPVP